MLYQNINICEICGSDKKVSFRKKYNKLLCERHVMQLNTHGKITNYSKRTREDKNEILICKDHAEICLYDRQQNITNKALVDLNDVDKCLEYRWAIKTRGYVCSRTGYKCTF